MFRSIKNIVTGANKRWCDTNNVVVNYLWNKSEKFTDVYKVIAQEFIIASGSISDRLLGPDRGKITSAGIKQKEINKLTTNDFFKFYINLLAIFYSIYIENNNHNSDNIFKSLTVLINRNIEPIIPNNNAPLDMRNEEIIKIGIKDIAKNFDFINSVDPSYYYLMVVIISTTYNEIMDNINKKLKG